MIRKSGDDYLITAFDLSGLIQFIAGRLQHYAASGVSFLQAQQQVENDTWNKIKQQQQSTERNPHER